MKKIEANWVDNFVGVFSPKRRLNRLRYKQAANIIQRKYEGAASGRRTDGWFTTSNDANAEISPSLSRLRNRSRDLVRNNPYASKGMQVIQSNVIGKGIRGEIKHPTKGKERKLREVWNAWTMTPACDYAGRDNFFGLQTLAMRSIAESGEVLIRLRRVEELIAISPISGQPIQVPPIQLQILESDFLNVEKGTRFDSKNGNRIIQGVELDPLGRRTGYHLYEEHPGGLDPSPTASFRTHFVGAETVAHIFREDRPGQLRGVPWLTPVMIRLRDFDEFEDATLMRQKIANLFTAFVHDTEGLEESETTDCELVDKMEPGTIEVLPPGKSVTLANPPGAGEFYSDYVSTVLHAIATGLGISYESLTGDLSQVNFSSARMGFLEMNRNIDSWRNTMLIPQMLDRTFDWFSQGVGLIGLDSRGSNIVWTPPRREMVDPTKEVPAAIKAVRGGIMTLSEVVRQAGNDPDKHFEEYKADNDRLDQLQLTLDSDPRKTQLSGAVQKEDVPAADPDQTEE